MPEFVLDTQGCVESVVTESRDNDYMWRDLDSFTQGYVQAVFWTECEHGLDRDEWNPEQHSSLPGDVTFSDLAPESLASMIQDCASFRADPDISAILDSVGDDERHGIDFWLTRNGHGAGFWDRGYGDAGDTLTEWAHSFGESDAYLGDDGKVYVS